VSGELIWVVVVIAIALLLGLVATVLYLLDRRAGPSAADATFRKTATWHCYGCWAVVCGAFAVMQGASFGGAMGLMSASLCVVISANVLVRKHKGPSRRWSTRSGA